MPREIYCLRDLGQGVTEPSASLIDDMNRMLDEHAHVSGLRGNFEARSGKQFKIAADEFQYYIIRRYEGGK